METSKSEQSPTSLKFSSGVSLYLAFLILSSNDMCVHCMSTFLHVPMLTGSFVGILAC